MGKHERRAYFQAIQKRYRQSDRAAKQTILNEFCEVCGYASKYAIRLLSRTITNASRFVNKTPRPQTEISGRDTAGTLEAHLVCQRSIVWQTLEGGYSSLVTALRSTIRSARRSSSRRFTESFSGDVG